MILLSQELPLSISLNQDTYRNAAQFARAGFEAAECCLPVHYHAEVDLSIFPAYLEEVSRRLRALLDEGSAPIFQIANRHALEDLLTAQYPWPWYGHSSDHRLHAPGEPLDGGLSGGAGVTEGAWLPPG